LVSNLIAAYTSEVSVQMDLLPGGVTNCALANEITEPNAPSCETISKIGACYLRRRASWKSEWSQKTAKKIFFSCIVYKLLRFLSGLTTESSFVQNCIRS